MIMKYYRGQIMQFTLSGAMAECVVSKISEQEKIRNLIYDKPFITHQSDQTIGAIKQDKELLFVSSDNKKLIEKLESNGHKIRPYTLDIIQYYTGELKAALMPEVTKNTWHNSKRSALDIGRSTVITISSDKANERYIHQKVDGLSVKDFPTLTPEDIQSTVELLTKDHYIETIEDAVKYGLIDLTETDCTDQTDQDETVNNLNDDLDLNLDLGSDLIAENDKTFAEISKFLED